MNKISGHTWLTFGFFLCCGVALALMSFRLFTHQQAQAPQTARNQQRTISFAGTDQWVLHRDQSLTVGDLKITYRGISEGEILLDVTLLQLDPQYAYRRIVPEALTRRSVQLGQRFFKIAAVHGAYLKLVPLTGQTLYSVG